ncbi:MAG TPA: FAD-dependent monooxygenase, partial [Flavipsychrobacter sp.]
MIKTVSLKLKPSEAADDTSVRSALVQEAGVPAKRITGYKVQKRSIDARGRQPYVILQVQVFIDEAVQQPEPFDPQLQNVTNAPHIVIIGAGPAGLFAALKLIMLGYKPIVLERGKDVRSRRRDLAAINKQGVVNPESNYCFGEGGAGTYSDGKLYTRSTKRGNVQRILELFVHFGADPDIIIDAHPHIGTNKLPHIITAMRDAIIACGGEIRFETKLTGLVLNGDRIKAVQCADGTTVACNSVILATGHSARDIYT